VKVVRSYQKAESRTAHIERAGRALAQDLRRRRAGAVHPTFRGNFDAYSVGFAAIFPRAVLSAAKETSISKGQWLLMF
jgi:hypothetical protein